MKSIILIIFLLIPISEAWSQNKKEVATQDINSSIPKITSASKFTYSIFAVNQTQFGYDIFQDNKLLIHQPQIPGISGNQGFKTSEDAKKVSALVIDKIKKGIFPPTVTLEELKNLKIKVD